MRTTQFYLLSIDQVDMQGRFTLLEWLAAQIGLTLNKSKTMFILAKVKGSTTMGTAKWPLSRTSRLVKPVQIKYLNYNPADPEDMETVQTVDSEIYLGSLIGRSVSAQPEIKRRLSLWHKRADD